MPHNHVLPRSESRARHLDALMHRHQLLEGEIDRELKRPMPDATAVNRLKRAKLRLKEEIQRESAALH